MAAPLVFVDSSEIHPGKLAEVKAAIQELAAVVEANEPRTLAYAVHLDHDGTRMTVLQIHPDSASMEHHMRVAAGVFAKFAGLITLTTVDVYGVASDAVLSALRAKARMLGAATVRVHSMHAGFSRMGPR